MNKKAPAATPPAIVFRPIDELVPYARNARQHSDEQIALLMGRMIEFGWTNPILADVKGIVAGHGRRIAASRLYEQGKTLRLPGGQEIPKNHAPVIDCTGWTEAQRRAYIIWDNRSAELATWDQPMLAPELLELRDDFGIDLAGIGFSEDEVSALTPVQGTEGLTDPDAAPEVPQVAATLPGDIWLMGEHRLMSGDCTSIDALERLCAGQRVAMWLTDPPYNVALGVNESPAEAKKRNRRTDGLVISNDAMEDEQFRQFLRDAYTAADAVMKAGATFYIWHSDSEGYNFRGAARDAGWVVRQCLIWKKSSLVMGRQDYQWQHEPCLYGWKDGAGHLWASDRKQTTILEFEKPSRNGEHPTMKPVALFEYQMLNNTKGGDLVLDSFGGSGTTLIAAEKNGRVARLMELDPKYCDVTVQRWQDFTGKKATLESDGRTFDEVKAERTSKAK